MNSLSDNNFIIWIILYVVFTLFFYLCGMKADWQKKRIESGLAPCKMKHAPWCYNNYHSIDKTHFINCFELLVATSFTSGVVMIAFYSVTNNKVLSSWTLITSTFLSLFFIFITLAGAPLEADDTFKEGKDKFLVKTIKGISFIKLKVIEDVISKEYGSYEKFITKSIKDLFEKEDRVKQGALIIRINSDFFNNVLPKDVNSSNKEKFKDYAYKILLIYKDDPYTLIDELTKLFNETIFARNVNILDVVEFLVNLKYSSNGLTQQKIDSYIDEQVNKMNPKPKKGNKKSVNELQNIIINANNAISNIAINEN